MPPTSTSAATREISPLLQRLRALLNGRTVRIPVRFPNEMSPRTGPEANLPEGDCHKLSDNYYFARDARGEVDRSKVLVDNTTRGAIDASRREEVAALESGLQLQQRKEGGGGGRQGSEETDANDSQAGKKGKTPGPLNNYSM